MANEKFKQKRQYLITMEGVAPVRAEFTVWAEDAQLAADIIKESPQSMNLRQRPDVDISRMQKNKVTVKDAMTSFVTPVKL